MFNTPARFPSVSIETLLHTLLQTIEIFELSAISVQMDLKPLYINVESLP